MQHAQSMQPNAPERNSSTPKLTRLLRKHQETHRARPPRSAIVRNPYSLVAAIAAKWVAHSSHPEAPDTQMNNRHSSYHWGAGNNRDAAQPP